jgi:MFS family permease
MRIYICPALMDWLVFLVHFAVFYAAGERHMTTGQCAWLGGTFQITYLSTSLVAGMLLSRRNARSLLLAGTVLGTACAVASLVATGFVPLLLALGLMGVGLALFFNAFQTFMRGESAPGGLARSVGLYTLGWSLGSSAGFLSSGCFYELGATALSLLSIAVGGVVLVTLGTYRPRAVDTPSADEHVEQGSPTARPVTPVYVWVGWLVIIAAMFVQRPIQTYFPKISATQGIHAFVASVPLALQMLIQGFVGLLFMRYRDLLYRRTPLDVFQGAAGLVLVLVWLWPAFAVSCVGISVLGVYSGFAYFAAVYYASNSGRRSFNIGVNECLVGVGSFSSLFVTQAWMDATGNENAMYLVCGVTLLASLLLQVVAASWPRGRVRPETG